MSAARPFQVVSPFTPTGDQPAAIAALTDRLGRRRERFACLLGATGTGKTFTMAHTIAALGKPTLILSHNKTLAAQLFEEMRELFPHNSVNYFVSYYDYYQPEAYIPARDIYIEKDSSRNDDLDKLRLAATSNILSRRDTIVVASVSCIFGLGSPEAYGAKVLTLSRGMRLNRRSLLLGLDAMQYKRSDIEFKRGQFRVRGDVLEVFPAYDTFAVRIELAGDEVETLRLINPTSGEELAEERTFHLFPANHYVLPEDTMQGALAAIRQELDARVLQLRSEGKLLEAQRLLSRTRYDLEMLEESGFCNGVENYSRFFDGRKPGEKPSTLLDYFDYAPPSDGTALQSREPDTGLETHATTMTRCNKDDWLLIIDESHVTLPQVHAMYNGDQMRKKVLVEHGFRLPSALDNRPLKFEEFEAAVPRILFVSATPAPYELAKVGGEVAEQVIRPTGLVDPIIEVKPAAGQVPDLLARCKERAAKGERAIVTALTKRLCEDLTLYLHERGGGLRVRYLHSEIDTLERVQILTDLRKGEFDVLVGVNLLREGLDLPEVSLVCILDADKEGFLRSSTSLIQQIGRAARNVNASVVMYADQVTPAMQAAIDETERRRARQLAYNAEHGITPQTVTKAIREGFEAELRAGRIAREAVKSKEPEYEVVELVRILEGEMLAAAQELQFEKAAKIRDQVKQLKSGGRPGALLASGKVRRSEVEAQSAGTAGAAAVRKAGMPGVRANKRNRRKSASRRPDAGGPA